MAELPFADASEVRGALGAIVTEYGPEVLSRPDAMSGLLADLLPDAPKAVRLLVAAAEADVARSLREQISRGLDVATATRLAVSAFAGASMILPEACAWAVAEIAAALGVTDQDAAMPAAAAHAPTPTPTPTPTFMPPPDLRPAGPAPSPFAGLPPPAPPDWHPAAPAMPRPAASPVRARSRSGAGRRRALLAIGGGVAVSAALVTGILLAVNASHGHGQPLAAGSRSPDLFDIPAARGVLALGVSDSGQALMADGYGKTSAGLWDVNARRKIFTLTDPDGAEVYSESFSPDGRVLATGDSRGNVYFWNTATGKVAGQLSEPTVGEGFTSLAYSENGRFLAAADANGAAYVWNTATGMLTTFPADPKNGGSMDVTITSDGKIVATGDGYGWIHVWDVATHAEVSSFKDPGGLSLFGLSISPNGKLLAGSVGGDTYLWDTATGKLLSTPTRTAGADIEAVEFSPDGRLLAIGDGTTADVLLWHANGAETQLAEQHGTGGYVLAFSPNGRTVAAVDGPDGSVKVDIWNSPAR